MVIKITVSLIQCSLNKGRNFDILRLLSRLTLSFCKIEMTQSMEKYLFIVIVAWCLWVYLFILIRNFIAELVKPVLFHWDSDQSASENFSRGIWQQRRKSCSPSVKGITVTELNRARISPFYFLEETAVNVSHLGNFFLLDGLGFFFEKCHLI